MTSIRGSILGAILLAMGVSGANAADLGHGRRHSIKDVPQVSPAATWYIRGDFGYGTYDDPIMVEEGRFDLTRTEIESTWSFGGGIGRYYSPFVRGDFTIDWRNETDVRGTLQGHPTLLNGTRPTTLESLVLMKNFYYDFNRYGRFNPYLGFGIGAVKHKTSDSTFDDGCGCTVTLQGEENWHVAASLMAGFSFKLRSKMHIDAGYKFSYLGETKYGNISGTHPTQGAGTIFGGTIEDLHTHEFRIGLRYDIR
ncbi:MAG: outer membrane beta-barrel protein [Pseudomonadota bacterium]